MKQHLFYNNMSLAAGNQIFLQRPHIDLLLEKAVRRPIVTLVAGAGYGKSRAVYSFARNYNVRTAWVQFSEGDNDSEGFWEKFLDAISVLGRESGKKLAGIGFPKTERQFKRYMTVPRTDVIANDKYIFVFDDIHLIHNKAVLEFIERSITTPFPNITSVIISRTEPEIDLSKLESKGQVSRIVEEDLRFSRDETAEYFRLLGLRPSAQTISAIYHDTEGWAFATHLAGLSLRNSRIGDAYVPQSLRSNIFGLVESEIYSKLSAALRVFLTKLSLIDQLVPDLLREIAGNEAKNYSLIDEMEQAGSFVQYDSYLNAYRIHHLVLEYLRGRQDDLSEDEKKKVWIQAAAWCHRNNHQMSAITYYQRAGDYSGMITAMYTFPMVLSKETALRFQAAMENIPPEFLKESPVMVIMRFRLLLNLELFDRAETELWEIIRRLEGQGHTGPEACRILSVGYTHLGFWGLLTCIHSHDYSFARYYERGHYYAGISGYKPPIPISMHLSSYVCRAADPGQMDRYNEALRDAVPHMAASMNGCAWGMDDLACGELAFFRGDLSRAEHFLSLALDKGREQSQYEIISCALAYLMRLNLCRGNAGAIPSLLEQLDASLDYPRYTNRRIYHDIVTGIFYLQTGKPEKIAAWLKSDFEESDFNTLIHGLEMMVKAKYHLTEKRYPAVLADLESRGSKYGPSSFVLGKLEAKVLEAVCRYRMNDIDGSLREMETAWELAKDNGLYMPFTELGKDMRALAGAALKEKSIAIPLAALEKIRRSAAMYAKNAFAVSRQYHAESPDPGKKSGTGAALSPREFDVLTGLSQGLTREEIARVSLISINTVKSAIRNAYSKLGAINRADAIRIATERGIL